MAGILILGAGGHGKVVADIARELGTWDAIAFLDDKFPESKKVSDWKIIGKISNSGIFKKDYPDAVVAIGANARRLEVIKQLLKEGFHLPLLVHPDASVSRSTSLGAGTVVCAQAAVKIDTNIGMGAIINAGSTIGHDCTLGDGVHVSPGSRVSGGVTIGDCSWLGSGAIVKEMVSVGRQVIIGAGTVVIRDVPDHVTVVGIPGRIIKQHEGRPQGKFSEYH